ncbi:hypothetical protein D3C86_2059700 [compost metagenome]
MYVIGCSRLAWLEVGDDATQQVIESQPDPREQQPREHNMGQWGTQPTPAAGSVADTRLCR